MRLGSQRRQRVAPRSRLQCQSTRGRADQPAALGPNGAPTNHVARQHGLGGVLSGRRSGRRGRPYGERAMPGLETVQTFIDQASVLRQPSDLRALMEEATLELGFSYFALIHHVDLSGYSASLNHMVRGELVALTSYPDVWVEAFQRERMVDNDPILLASHRTNVGFLWEEMDKLIMVTQEHRDHRARSRQAGIGDGFTVPAHVPGEANGSCNFAMEVGRPVPLANVQLAQLIGGFAFQAARAMVVRAQQGALPPTRPLTQRQLDCIRLVARGKHDEEIAIILGISSGTVKRHIEDARMSYEVATRIQVVMRAMFEGQLGLVDALR